MGALGDRGYADHEHNARVPCHGEGSGRPSHCSGHGVALLAHLAFECQGRQALGLHREALGIMDQRLVSPVIPEICGFVLCANNFCCGSHLCRGMAFSWFTLGVIRETKRVGHVGATTCQDRHAVSLLRINRQPHDGFAMEKGAALQPQPGREVARERQAIGQAIQKGTMAAGQLAR